MTDTVTHMVLTLPAVVTGLHKLMLYAVDGVALGGWQLVDLALMALVAIELLSLIFLKVVLILLGALLYATGPITIGLVATDSGAAVARAWAAAAALLVAVPVVWATLFAVGALLVGDAGTAGPLIAGNSSVGSLLGGVLLAVAGAASLWMCLRAAREAMGLLRMQLGGLLALSHRGSVAACARRHRSRPPRAPSGASARGSRRQRVAPAASWQPPAPEGPRSCAAGAQSATSPGTGRSAPRPRAAARPRERLVRAPRRSWAAPEPEPSPCEWRRQGPRAGTHPQPARRPLSGPTANSTARQRAGGRRLASDQTAGARHHRPVGAPPRLSRPRAQRVALSRVPDKHARRRSVTLRIQPHVRVRLPRAPPRSDRRDRPRHPSRRRRNFTQPPPPPRTGNRPGRGKR